MNLTIKNVLDEKDVSRLIAFIEKQEQQYPRFQEWIHDKLQPRILSERYKTFFGIEENEITGCVVYDEFNDRIDIKNLRIDKDYRHKNLGQFLIRQVECFNKPLYTDITVTNFSAVQFFMKSGFVIESAQCLYKENQLEYVIKKLKGF